MDIAVILVEPERGLNIGFIARTMANFGYSDLRLVRPRKSLMAPAARFASHASKLVETSRSFDSIHEATSDVNFKVGTTALRGSSSKNVLRTATTPVALATNASKVQGRLGILLGREGSGLTNEELELCDLIVTIPSSGIYPTMNVSHAAAIILYELSLRSRSKAGMTKVVSQLSLVRLLAYFETLLENSDIQRHRVKLTVRAFQNVLGRGQISMREASLLMGALRRVGYAKHGNRVWPIERSPTTHFFEKDSSAPQILRGTTLATRA